MMKQNQISEKMLEFGKTMFDNTFMYMSTVQGQNEKIAVFFLEKLTWVPEEGKKALFQYMATYKKMQEDYKSRADENYKNFFTYFMPMENSNSSVNSSARSTMMP